MDFNLVGKTLEETGVVAPAVLLANRQNDRQPAETTQVRRELEWAKDTTTPPRWKLVEEHEEPPGAPNGAIWRTVAHGNYRAS